MAKADAIAKFRASQPFINACKVYYGDGFDNFLKQVGSIYLDFDLSRISMEDSLLTTPTSGDIVSEETDNSIHTEQDPKDDSVVLVQPALEGPVAPVASSVEDLPAKTQRTLQPKTKRTLLPRTFRIL